MTLALVYRFAWKECRQLLPIDLAILFVVVLFPVVSGLFSENLDWTVSLGTSLVFGVIVIALVNGTLLFAPENDHQTVRFLQALPITGRQLATVKLLAGGLPYVLIGLVGFLFLVWRSPSLPFLADMAPQLGVQGAMVLGMTYMTVQSLFMFVAGCLASIVLRQTILALCAAPLLVFAAHFVLSVTLSPFSSPGSLAMFYIHQILMMGLVVTGTAAILGTLGGRWVQNQVGGTRHGLRTASERTVLAPGRRGLESVWGEPLRLFWQSCRLSGQSLLLFLAAYILAIGVLSFSMRRVSVDENSPLGFAAMGMQFAPVLFAGLAAMVFWGDQRRHSYRFFQQHPIHPRQLWAARIAPWWITAWIAAGLYIALNQILFSGIWFDPHFTLENIGYWITDRSNWYLQTAGGGSISSFVLFGLAVGFGQLFSLLFRSGILAFFAAAGCEFLVLCLVWYLTCLGTGPGLVLCLPMAIVFGAGWWYSRAWIAERLGWRQRLCGVGIVLVSAGVALGVLAGIRSTEVSRLTAIDPRLAPPPELAAWRKETSSQPPTRRQLLRNLTELDPVSFANWIPELIATLNDASPAEIEALFDVRETMVSNSTNTPVELVGFAFEKHLAAGKLAEARQNLSSLIYLTQIQTRVKPIHHWPERLVRWVDAEGQSAESIRTLISEIESLPDWYPVISYTVSSHWVDSWDPGGFAAPNLSNAQPFLGIPGYPFARHLGVGLPWEVFRAKQLLQLKLNACGWHWARRYHPAWLNHSREIERRIRLPATANPQRPPFRIGDVNLRNYDHLEASSPVIFADRLWTSAVERLILFRRFLLVRLALAAYRLEHKSYPDSLDPLEPYFSQGMPKDPANGQNFVYHSHGLDGYLISQRLGGGFRGDETHILKPGQPFLLPTSIPVDALHDSPPVWMNSNELPRNAKLFGIGYDRDQPWETDWIRDYFELCKLPF